MQRRSFMYQWAKDFIPMTRGWSWQPVEHKPCRPLMQVIWELFTSLFEMYSFRQLSGIFICSRNLYMGEMGEPLISVEKQKDMGLIFLIVTSLGAICFSTWI